MSKIVDNYIWTGPSDLLHTNGKIYPLYDRGEFYKVYARFYVKPDCGERRYINLNDLSAMSNWKQVENEPRKVIDKFVWAGESGQRYTNGRIYTLWDRGEKFLKKRYFVIDDNDTIRVKGRKPLDRSSCWKRAEPNIEPNLSTVTSLMVRGPGVVGYYKWTGHICEQYDRHSVYALTDTGDSHSHSRYYITDNKRHKWFFNDIGKYKNWKKVPMPGSGIIVECPTFNVNVEPTINLMKHAFLSGGRGEGKTLMMSECFRESLSKIPPRPWIGAFDPAHPRDDRSDAMVWAMSSTPWKTIKKEEEEMNIKENVTLVNGRDVDDMSADDLLCEIRNVVRRRREFLADLPEDNGNNERGYIDNARMQYDNDIAKLTELLNSKDENEDETEGD